MAHLSSSDKNTFAGPFLRLGGGLSSLLDGWDLSNRSMRSNRNAKAPFHPNEYDRTMATLSASVNVFQCCRAEVNLCPGTQEGDNVVLLE